MGEMTSLITSITIVYPTVYSGRSKETSKLRVTGLCAGNSLVTGEFPAQMASNAENVSIGWRHNIDDIIENGPWDSSNYRGNSGVQRSLLSRYFPKIISCLNLNSNQYELSSLGQVWYAITSYYSRSPPVFACHGRHTTTILQHHTRSRHCNPHTGSKDAWET